MLAKRIWTHLPRLHCTHGNGLSVPGHMCMLIMPAHLNVSVFLIVVDAYFKWMKVVPIWHATSQSTIEKLRIIFAMHGLPEMLVSDNGTPFTCAEFQEFVNRNAIWYVLTSLYHRTSNRLAERTVQFFKAAMRKMTTSVVGYKDPWINGPANPSICPRTDGRRLPLDKWTRPPYHTLICTCSVSWSELHANDNCMLISDEQDEVHVLIPYVFRRRKQCRTCI